MRVLPISDGQGGLVYMAADLVLARMLFPQDEALYRSALAWASVQRGWDSGEELIAVRRDTLETLITSPSAYEITRLSLASTPPGLKVGQLLTFILSSKAAHPQHPPSISKAWDVFAAYYKDQKTADGQRVSASKAYLTREWKRYKPVAHLWAAHCSLNPQARLPIGTFSLEGLLDLLCIAETIRRDAESTFAAAQKVPVLDPAESWSCPPDLGLPNVQLTYQPLPPEMLTLLRRRRARPSG